MLKERLNLKHRDVLNARLASLNTELSEYSFANLYLFRDIHDYHIMRDDDAIWICGKTRDGESYAMPAEDIRNMETESIRRMFTECSTLFPVPEEWLSCLDPSEYNFTYNDGDSDYVYRTEKLATYRGKQMHKKKNLLNQFLSLYRYESVPLTEKERPQALEILESWVKESVQPGEDTDYQATKEALELCGELNLQGVMYYIEGKPAGFVMGEELTDSVFVLHFAKGLREFKGIYQFMYNSFAQSMLDRFPLMNMEQDLGNTALRQAKSSYRPDKMLAKYRVSPKS